MSSLIIRWDSERRVWLVVDEDISAVIERFEHIADAAWFVQAEERQPAS